MTRAPLAKLISREKIDSEQNLHSDGCLWWNGKPVCTAVAIGWGLRQSYPDPRYAPGI
jgi:hypothetical protein